MKKMQCEICGSNEIKKISDGVFECQSCGVQYSLDEAKKLFIEISGEIKVDHSAEAENAVKRGKQFEREGNTEKAKEYYQKALDYDLDNKAANDALDKAVNDNCFIINKNISGDDAVKKSLEYLYSREIIVPDIFSNITDVTITEKYYPFVETNADLVGQFAGTACYKHEIPYTVYKDKQVLTSDGYKTKQVAEEEYRTEIERIPATGFFTADASEICSVSKEFGEKIARCDADKIDAAKNPYSGLFLKTETKVTDIINNEKDLEKLDVEKIVNCGGVLKYNNISIDMDFRDFKDNEWSKRLNKKFSLKINSQCQLQAEYNCPGDSSENVTYSLSAQKTTARLIYIPLLILDFKYRGGNYTVLSVLNDKYFETAAVYPAHKQAVEGLKKFENAKQRQNEGSVVGSIAFLSGLLGLILWIAGSFIDDPIMYFGIILLLAVTLPCGITAFFLAGKKAKELESIRQEIILQKQSITDILNKMYACFMSEYSKTHDIVKASNAAKKSENLLLTELEFCDDVSNFENPVTTGLRSEYKETKTTEEHISAENYMAFFAHFGIVPIFAWMGIFVLFFRGKAKKQNGGNLSKKAKKYLKMGIIEFSILIVILLIIFTCLLLDEYII